MRKRDWAALVASVVLVAGAVVFRERGRIAEMTAEFRTSTPDPYAGAVRGPDGRVVRLPGGGVMKSAHQGRLDGEREARADIAAGMLGWRTLGGWGYPPTPHPWSVVTEVRILERDFGVVLKQTTAGQGCIAPPNERYLDARRDAYNAIMKPRIEAKFGKDVFTVAGKRAEEETAQNKAAYEATQEASQEATQEEAGAPDGSPRATGR